jgi:transcriptional regulator with XRE-family HTH domain
MNQQKVFFADNIKFLRKRKKLGQEELANLLGISRAKLTAIENGHTKAPQPEDLIRIAEHFKISLDAFVRIDLGKLGAFKMRELEMGNDVYMAGSQMRVLAITVDRSTDKENLEFVPVKAKAGYRAGYNDPEFIATLPKFSMPNLPNTGTFRMFPTIGDSMLPIPENSEIITKYVENWTTLKPDTLCIVILKGEQDFVFKQVTVQQEDGILLKSLNSVYAPYTVPSEDVLEIWEYYKYQTATLPEPSTDFQELKRLILEVKDGLDKNEKTG